ncbi:transmembrane protein 272 [Octopus bimaculoides]|nr:transmembrane protein 272 [Octopus bimaculoides]XP_052824477.1 transmembrane protein 272 [Octopus bimaculoides]XP_052824478.1 transmembrane protein 272 [Octopus bimaculoides]XP_052824479.1 transmembrane protein 272 [Octopus bimaculoides]
MSMLTRKGTMVRKSRGTHSRSQSMKRTPSRGGSTKRPTPGLTPAIVVMDSTESEDKDSSTNASSPPAKNIVGTIVGYDDESALYKTTVDWTASRVSVQSNYEAVYVQITEATKEANSSIDFVCQAVRILTNTRLYTVFLAVSTALPIAMMTAGVKYLNDCPKQPKIPVYLLVGGCFGTLKMVYTIWRQVRQRRFDSLPDLVGFDPTEEAIFSTRSYRLMDTILVLFLICWILTGTYWVFLIWKPNFEQLLHDPNNWCNKSVYGLAFFQIIVSYAWMALALLTLIGLFISYYCRRSKPGEQRSQTTDVK